MQNAVRHFFCVLIDDAAFLKAGKISPHDLAHGNWRFPNCLMAMGFGLMLILPMVAQSTIAQAVTANITAGSSPAAVAINPVTNKIYVANQFSVCDALHALDGSMRVLYGHNDLQVVRNRCPDVCINRLVTRQWRW